MANIPHKMKANAVVSLSQGASVERAIVMSGRGLAERPGELPVTMSDGAAPQRTTRQEADALARGRALRALSQGANLEQAILMSGRG